MTVTSPAIFRTWAKIYRDAGYWPRPIRPRTKMSVISRWQRADSEFTDKQLQSWLIDYSDFGVGLVMGSPLPDGTTLGAIDIDHDAYVPVLRALLGDPICSRIGKKGIAYFVRVQAGVNNKKFSVKGEFASQYGQVVECLFHRSLCVIPPTIHPDTQQPYRWVGKALHEVLFEQLPIIEA